MRGPGPDSARFFGSHLNIRGTNILKFILVIVLLGSLASTASASAASDTLQPGQRLHAGDELRSGNNDYRLVMQGDGNLVLYAVGGKALWSSRTVGHGGANVVMQGDGNLVIYKDGKALWASETDGNGGALLRLQNDGNLVIYKDGKALWATYTNRRPPKRRSVLRPGQRLKPGRALHSPNRRYRLVMQGDGNLVLYKKRRGAIWSTRTSGHRGAQAVMQGDGNFVIYEEGKALWASRTSGHGGAFVQLQDDGNLVIYKGGKALWASKWSMRRRSRKEGGWTSNPRGRWRCTKPGNGCVAHTGFRPNAGTGRYTPWWGQRRNPRGNCTAYVAYRLIRNGAKQPGSLGNAVTWGPRIRRYLGANHVNGTPAIGAVAWWDGRGALNGNGAGHVAYIERVKGSMIYLSDSRWNSGSARWTVSIGSRSWPDAFLHIKDKPRRRR